MSSMPSLPESFYAPLAIVFDPGEVTALYDALLVHDLMLDGCIADVVELMDQSNDGGYCAGIARTLAEVRTKLDAAMEPHRREMRRFMDEAKRWRDENGEDRIDVDGDA